MPAELQRKFRLMRELDERTHQLEMQVDADCVQQLKELAERQQGAAGGRLLQTLVGARAAWGCRRHVQSVPTSSGGLWRCRGGAGVTQQAATCELGGAGGAGVGQPAAGADRPQHQRAGEAVRGEGGGRPACCTGAPLSSA